MSFPAERTRRGRLGRSRRAASAYPKRNDVSAVIAAPLLILPPQQPLALAAGRGLDPPDQGEGEEDEDRGQHRTAPNGRGGAALGGGPELCGDRHLVALQKVGCALSVARGGEDEPLVVLQHL